MPDDPDLTPLQRVSVPLLVLLSRTPKWLLLVVVLGLTAGGLMLENALGGVLLLFLALFLIWLALVGWAVLTPFARLIRLLVVGIVLYAAFTRFM